MKKTFVKFEDFAFPFNSKVVEILTKNNIKSEREGETIFVEKKNLKKAIRLIFEKTNFKIK